MDFATRQTRVREQFERTLRRSALLALGRFGQPNWSHGVVKQTAEYFKDRLVAELGRDLKRADYALVREFSKQVEDILELTTKPTPASRHHQADQIARSLSTSIVNAARYAAVEEVEDAGDWEKVWLTMDDAKVRPTHQDVDNERVPLRSKFRVGGAEMDRPGDLTAPVSEWINCRCIIAIVPKGEQVDLPDAIVAAVSEVTPSEEPEGVSMDEETRDDVALVPWHGVLAPEGVATGDGRKFATESLRWRDLPLSLLWQKSNEPGHDGSVIVGRIDEVYREGNLIWASGVMLSTPEADEAVNLLAERAMRGVSVDVDDVTASFVAPDGRELSELTEDEMAELDGKILMSVDDGRISAATLCAIPAFAEAYISLGPRPVDAETLAAAAEVELLASDIAEFDVIPKTEDGPGWLTHPVDTDRLRDYWVRGAGAAKIGWGTPGDFNRCRVNLAEYVKPQHLSGYCANRHYDALGFWPGQHHAGETEAMAVEAPILSLSASGAPLPSEWFADPGLEGPTPITVTEDGRVFGHLATWGTCHIGFPDACVTAPPSPSGYAYFQTGSVLTDAGPVAVGQITMDTGHADIRAKHKAALSHYDNTGTCAADVAAGEDSFGIWVAGSVRGDLTEEKAHALRAAALSGDWRSIGGQLELVAALAVNVPGFPIPRTAIAASGGVQQALIAAGSLVHREDRQEFDVAAVVRATIETYESRKARDELLALQREYGLDPKSLLAEMQAE